MSIYISDKQVKWTWAKLALLVGTYVFIENYSIWILVANILLTIAAHPTPLNIGLTSGLSIIALILHYTTYFRHGVVFLVYILCMYVPWNIWFVVSEFSNERVTRPALAHYRWRVVLLHNLLPVFGTYAYHGFSSDFAYLQTWGLMRTTALIFTLSNYLYLHKYGKRVFK